MLHLETNSILLFFQKTGMLQSRTYDVVLITDALRPFQSSIRGHLMFMCQVPQFP